MEEKILVRFGEIFLKGRNRNHFVKLLFSNLKHALKRFDLNVQSIQNRYLVENYDESQRQDIINAIGKVSGIYSISVCLSDKTSFENIESMAIKLAKSTGTFKVQTNRADKTFKLNSMGISREIGASVLKAYPDLKVDLFNPNFVINIELRENGESFVYSDVIDGLKGMPVGCSGKGLVMLSGGIDSPVAGFMMMKRGMTIDAIHFHSFPYTSEKAKEKVVSLAKKLAAYELHLNLHVVPFTNIQTEIHKSCRSDYMVTLMRRFMIRIAQKVASKIGAGSIITGESLGQVASQTMEGITVTDDAVSIPVFRPLIAFDKEDITLIARKIDTFETSILPYEDCCTVFLPENPVIKPKIRDARYEETKLDVEALVEEAVNGIEIIDCTMT